MSKFVDQEFFLWSASLHFARENTVSKNEVLLFFSKFCRPPCGAHIPVKLESEVSVSKF